MHDAQDPEDIAKWDKWFGIECNNRAWALAESRIRTRSDDDEMLHCAPIVGRTFRVVPKPAETASA